MNIEIQRPSSAAAVSAVRKLGLPGSLSGFCTTVQNVSVHSLSLFTIRQLRTAFG